MACQRLGSGVPLHTLSEPPAQCMCVYPARLFHLALALSPPLPDTLAGYPEFLTQQVARGQDYANGELAAAGGQLAAC